MFGTKAPAGCSPAFAVEASTAGATVDLVDVDTPWPEQQVAKTACDPTVPFQVRRVSRKGGEGGGPKQLLVHVLSTEIAHGVDLYILVSPYVSYVYLSLTKCGEKAAI